jgi:hypothetical protein
MALYLFLLAQVHAMRESMYCCKPVSGILHTDKTSVLAARYLVLLPEPFHCWCGCTQRNDLHDLALKLLQVKRHICLNGRCHRSVITLCFGYFPLALNFWTVLITLYYAAFNVLATAPLILTLKAL